MVSNVFSTVCKDRSQFRRSTNGDLLQSHNFRVRKVRHFNSKLCMPYTSTVVKYTCVYIYVLEDNLQKTSDRMLNLKLNMICVIRMMHKNATEK